MNLQEFPLRWHSISAKENNYNTAVSIFDLFVTKERKRVFVLITQFSSTDPCNLMLQLVREITVTTSFICAANRTLHVQFATDYLHLLLT